VISPAESECTPSCTIIVDRPRKPPACGVARLSKEVERTWMQKPTDHGGSPPVVGADCFHANRAGAEQFVGAVARLIAQDRGLPIPADDAPYRCACPIAR
jgi:hypothetical protein